MRKNRKAARNLAIQEVNNVVPIKQFLPKKKNRVLIYPKNLNQENYLLKLQEQEKHIVFAIGPAGTGKTMLACQQAVRLFQEGEVDKIVVTRPAVSVDEQHGFLPGTLQQKMEPWTRPIFDVFEEYYYAKEIETFIKEGVIEISPLAYMRGRTFKNSYIIADEMQNSTPNQMKMITTRIGENSKMIITGDLNQSDLQEKNGLYDLINKYEVYNNNNELDELIQFIKLENTDIERSQIVKTIMNIYS